MVKSFEFILKLQVLWKWNVFHFGQILFNLAHVFAAHHAKSFVPAFFMSLLIIYLITLSLKKKLFFWSKIWKKSWILDPTICTNSVQTSTGEPWCNEGPSVRQNTFTITRFHYLEAFFHVIFYHDWGEEEELLSIHF